MNNRRPAPSTLKEFFRDPEPDPTKYDVGAPIPSQKYYMDYRDWRIRQNGSRLLNDFGLIFRSSNPGPYTHFDRKDVNNYNPWADTSWNSPSWSYTTTSSPGETQLDRLAYLYDYYAWDDPKSSAYQPELFDSKLNPYADRFRNFGNPSKHIVNRGYGASQPAGPDITPSGDGGVFGRDRFPIISDYPTPTNPTKPTNGQATFNAEEQYCPYAIVGGRKICLQYL